MMNMNEPWTLAIDFGTSYTVAAIRVRDRNPEVIEIAGERRVPSVVFADEDGSVIVGRAADDLASSHPDRAVRAPKTRLGDPSPIVLGGRPRRVTELVAALLSHVYAEALRHQGSAPTEVRLTHPATWSRPRLNRLLEAASIANLPNPVLVPEPVAAAVTYADEVGMSPGGHVAVYDLGGGTFDTAALRSASDGFVVIGRPSGDAAMGGELFDELLANRAGEQLAPEVWEQLQVSDEILWQRAANNLRTEARRVKELLSSHPYSDMLIGLPEGLVQQRVTQDELDELIGPYVRDSVEVLARCVADAGLSPSQLDAIYLVGGSSRSPVVERMVAERFPGVRVSRRGDPKTSVALGATRVTGTASLDGALAAAPSSTLDPAPATNDAPQVPPAPPLATPGTAAPAAPTSLDATAVEGAGSTVFDSDPANEPTAALPRTEATAPVHTFAPPGATPFTPPPPPSGTRAKPTRRTGLLVGSVIAAVAALLIVGIAVASRGKHSSTAPTTPPTEAPDGPRQSPLSIATRPTDSTGPGPTAPTRTTPPPTATPTNPPPTNPPPTNPPPTNPPPTNPPPTNPPRSAGPTAAQVRASLLTLSDVGNGYVEKEFTEGSRFACEGDPVANAGITEGVLYENLTTTRVAQVRQVTEVYRDKAEADAVIAQDRSNQDSCNNAKEQLNGTPVTITISKSDAVQPVAGLDDVLAFGEFAAGDGISIKAVTIVGQAGRLITQVSYIFSPGGGTVSNDETAALAGFFGVALLRAVSLPH